MPILEMFNTICLDFLSAPSSEKFIQVMRTLIRLPVPDIVITDICESLANKFQVAASTIIRWESGVSSPHPKIQIQVVQALLDYKL